MPAGAAGRHARPSAHARAGAGSPLRADPGGVVFDTGETPDYPLFHEPQYVISLATRIVQVAREGRRAVASRYCANEIVPRHEALRREPGA